MKLLVKSRPLAVTQAKVTRQDGSVEYFFSKPALKLWDIKGRLWLRSRIKAMKEER